MPIKQLKKEFKEHFGEEDPNDIWQWIKIEVIPRITKAMLVEEYEKEEDGSWVRKNVWTDKSLKRYVKGFNQCCALQREQEKKIIKITKQNYGR